MADSACVLGGLTLNWKLALIFCGWFSTYIGAVTDQMS